VKGHAAAAAPGQGHANENAAASAGKICASCALLSFAGLLPILF
jgi:hypothetical protein